MANERAPFGEVQRRSDDYSQPPEETNHGLVHEFSRILQDKYSTIDKDHNNDLDQSELDTFGQSSQQNQKLADFLSKNRSDIASLDGGSTLTRQDAELLFCYSGSKEDIEAAKQRLKDESIEQVRNGAVSGALTGSVVGFCVGGPAGLVPGTGIGLAFGGGAGLLSGGFHYWSQSNAETKVQNLHI